MVEEQQQHHDRQAHVEEDTEHEGLGAEAREDEDQAADDEAELLYLEQERLKAPTYRWIDQAKWTPSPWSHYILRGMDNAKRRNAVLEFIEGYRATHGCMPTGTHTLRPDLSVQFPQIEETNQQRSDSNGCA